MLEAEAAMQTAQLNTAPGPEYLVRQWQGIPGIERTQNGRLWVAYYSGGEGEGPQYSKFENYVLLTRSKDNGNTWSKPVVVVDPPGQVRAFDPCLWLDPQGRLWMFWAQTYKFFDGRAGVWCSVCRNPDSDNPEWTSPRRIANGIMMNKPIALSTGEWLLPCAIWDYERMPKLQFLEPGVYFDLPEERYSNVYRSDDQGESFHLLGKADVPDRHFDEHMIVEKRDGSLWMLVRTSYGIGQSFSYDRGATWTPGEDSGLGGPVSRFFIGRLRSGNLLLINHHQFSKRDHLTALVSEDDGATWRGGLLLDGRDLVSYPDAVQGDDGRIYAVYDRDRYGEKEILMAVFTEQDIVEGRCITQGARLQHVINKA